MRDTLPVRVRFGDFELDLRAGELRQGRRTILLQEQPFRLLLMLVEHSGEIATREKIQKNLWPNDTVVEFDKSITAAIKRLRKALGDSAGKRPRFHDRRLFRDTGLGEFRHCGLDRVRMGFDIEIPESDRA